MEIAFIIKVFISLTTQKGPLPFLCVSSVEVAQTIPRSYIAVVHHVLEEELMEWMNLKKSQNVCFALDIELYR